MLKKINHGNSHRAVIVGSGPSARGFEPPNEVTIIAVNGAIDWLTRADYFFTLDPSSANLHRMHNPLPGVRYTAAVPESIVLPPHVDRFERISKRGREPIRHNSPEWWLWRWSAVKGLSDRPGYIHSGNSAYGALGLAYHLGFTKIALVGVDGSSDPRIEGGHPHNLSHLPLLFASALNQINVVSCGFLPGLQQQSLEDWLNG